MPVGYWCPVLHAHLPYVRHPEYPSFLEEDWFFEALTETYIPIVRVLDGLLRDGVEYRLTMTLSPTGAIWTGWSIWLAARSSARNGSSPG
jgi:1,4-alpha-glucan branching enzyme